MHDRYNIRVNLNSHIKAKTRFGLCRNSTSIVLNSVFGRVQCIFSFSILIFLDTFKLLVLITHRHLSSESRISIKERPIATLQEAPTALQG